MRFWILFLLAAAVLVAVGGWTRVFTTRTLSSPTYTQAKILCPDPACKKLNKATNNACEHCGAKLYEDVKLCKETQKRANQHCPNPETKRVARSSLPGICTTHTAPVPTERTIRINICAETGLEENGNCPEFSQRTYPESKRPGRCDKHTAPEATVLVDVCKESGMKANTYCKETEPRRLPKSRASLECTTHKAPPVIPSALKWQGIEMIRIPAGEFTMGSNESADEKPIRTVYLDEFWIGKTEVTVAQFRKYCDSAPYTYNWAGNKPSWGWIDDHPMVNVDWNEARAYCKWAGGDLPTEAQWEKAARGTDGLVYPWGNEWDSGKCQNSKSSTATVGSFPRGASPFGCLDMAGNVWEWCADWYADKYDETERTNPKGPTSGQSRSLRGGSWYGSLSNYFRGSYRFNSLPTDRYFNYGFRLTGK